MVVSSNAISDIEDEYFSCPVTLPSEDKSTWYHELYAHHNNVLAVYLYKTGSRTIGQPGAWIQPDGYIHSKYGWVKKVAGKLSVRGERLDGESSRPFKVNYNDQLIRAGGIPGGFLFPDPGCWKITGKLAGEELSFVIEIIDSN